MKRIAFLVTLFALFAQFTWGQDTIRIMTINIHQGSDTTLQRLGEVIKEYHPDFAKIGINEQISTEQLLRKYVEKIRNQAYLENRLQNFQKYEETSQNNLKGIIEKNKETKEKEVRIESGELGLFFDEILDKGRETEEDKKLDVNVFWTIFRTMIISEFFDHKDESNIEYIH